MANPEFYVDAEAVQKADFGKAASSVEDQIYGSQQQDLDNQAEASETSDNIQENQARQAEGAPTQDEEAKLKEDDPNTPEHEDLDESDPRRDGVGWNIGDAWAEFSSAITGGLRDTGSSIITAPERLIDMVNGDMEKAGTAYAPDFNPLGGNLNPITKTWWGNLLRGVVHFGSTGAAITGAIAALPLSGGAAVAAGTAGAGATWLSRVRGLNAVATGALGWKKAMAMDAAIGAGSDLISEYSQDENAMGALKQQFPALDTPLATQDQDSPMVMTAKNVAEGLGIGFIGGALMLGLGKALGGRFKGKRLKPAGDTAVRAQGTRAAMEGRAKEIVQMELDLPERTPADRAADQALADRVDVADQIKEEGMRQLELPGFGGYKSKYVLADDDMGNALPRGRTHTIMKQLDEIDNNGFDGELGSTYATVTPAQMRRSNEIVDVDGKTYEEVMKRSLGEERYARLIQEAADTGMTAREVHRSAYARMQRLNEGRNTSGMSVDQYWDTVFEGEGMDRFGGIDAWSMKNVVAADLVNAGLFKEMRNFALAAREGNTVFDVWDVDGPVAAIRDRFIFGMTNVKKSRMLISSEFRKLRTVEGADKANKVLKERLTNLQRETEAGLDMLLEAVQKSKSSALPDALLEAFSMSNKLQNWEDIDKYMKARLRGADFQGKKQASMVVRELQGVMVHSVLSGPKTPIRAVMGTTLAGFSRPLAQALGGMFTLDPRQMSMGLSATSAMVEALPEAWKLFKTRLNSYWAGDMSTLKTRYVEYDKRNQQWEAMGEWVMQRGTDGDKAAYLLGNMARGLNDNSLLTYSSKLMAATDDSFGYIMARARARMQAMQESWAKQSEGPAGTLPIVDKKFMKSVEDKFMKDITNEDGTINWTQDAALKYMQEEATLTRDLSGFAKGMEQLMNRSPWTKPFFLFARTGINGLELTAKHMPLLNRFVADERRIANATMEMANNSKLLDIGIENGQQLANAKAIQKGRMVMGTGLVTMASMFFMTDRLTGNGPMNTAQRKAWEAAGWKPRSIKLGDVWVSYDSFEPFNSMLSYVADVGDNSQLMGPEWAEQRLQRLALVLTQGTVSKSYLSGLSQLVELFQNPGEVGKVAANLMNNQIPMGGLRNELGKLLNPYMKELNSDLASSLRNRNQLTELIAGDKLPVKYDFLTGKPIKDHSFVTRMFNMFSPVQLNVINSPGRTMLFNSGYDLNIAVYANPDGVNLKDYPEVRSQYQKAMGEQDLESQLNELASRKDVQESLKQMEKDRNAGLIGKEPRTYLVNELIAGVIRRAQTKAWAVVALDPEVQRLIRAQQKIEASELSQKEYPDAANDRYREAQELLNMPK